MTGVAAVAAFAEVVIDLASAALIVTVLFTVIIAARALIRAHISTRKP